MLQVALVGSVSDANRWRAAVADYFQLVQDTIALLHEANPNEVSNVELPQPTVTEAAGADSCRYELPSEWQLDSQIVPNASLASNLWVLSLLPTFTAQLLESQPLTIESAIDIRRPATIVARVQLPKLFDAIGPWVDYGFAVAAQQAAE